MIQLTVQMLRKAWPSRPLLNPCLRPHDRIDRISYATKPKQILTKVHLESLACLCLHHSTVRYKYHMMTSDISIFTSLSSLQIKVYWTTHCGSSIKTRSQLFWEILQNGNRKSRHLFPLQINSSDGFISQFNICYLVPPFEWTAVNLISSLSGALIYTPSHSYKGSSRCCCPIW